MIDIAKRFPRCPPVGRLLRIPVACLSSGTVVRVLGGVSRGFRWVVGSAPHGCWLGSSETERQHAVCLRAESGSVMFNVGANVGFYTLALARLAGLSGRVYAFEPEAGNMVKLRLHAGMNRLDNVRMLQKAISDKPGMVCFSVEENCSTGRVGSEWTEYLVAVTSLDSLMAQENCELPSIIKIDVEGAEALVLEGARGILAARQTTWFIAFHGERAKRDCFAILDEYGYHREILAGEPVDEDFVGDEIVASPGSNT